MKRQIKQELKGICDGSALKQSAIPILVCDENFVICSKTVGAQAMLAGVRLNSAVTSRLDKEVLDTFKSGSSEPMLTTFALNNGTANVLIFRGAVSDINYFALVFIPPITFGRSCMPKYLLSACSEVCKAVSLMISSEPIKNSKLESTLIKIARLCSFFEKADKIKAEAHHADYPIINQILRLLCDEAKPYVSLIGGSVIFQAENSVQYTVPFYSGDINMLILSFLLSSLLMSKNNRTEVSVRESRTKGSIDVVYSFSALNIPDTDLSSFDGLMKEAMPIAPELGIIYDMVNTLNIQAFCGINGSEMSIGFTLPAEPAQLVTLTSPAMDRLLCEFADMIKEMFGIFEPYFESKQN